MPGKPKKRKVSNPLALAALALLSERPMHPYEMASTMRQRHKEASIKINYGSLYTVIDQLLRAGYIAPQETVRYGRRPERTVYVLEEAGRTELHDWLAELLSVPVKEYTRFEAGLALMPVLSPDHVVDLLHQRIAELRREIDDTKRQLDSARVEGEPLPRLFLVEADYVQALRGAEYAFVRDLAAEIKHGRLDGLELWRRLHDRAAK